MVERILAIKLAGLGDLLLCEPALRSLRTAYPKAAIDVMTTPESAELVMMFEGNYDVFEFPKQLFDSIAPTANVAGASQLVGLSRRLRAREYDLAVLFHHLTTRAGSVKHQLLLRASGASRTVGLDNGRGGFLDIGVADYGFGALHEAEYMLGVATAAGGAPVNPAPLVVDQSGGTRPDLQLPHAAIYPVTGVYSNARNWPVDRYIALVDMLDAAGITTVLVGGDDSVEAAHEIATANPYVINMAGRTSLRQLAGMLSVANVAIGADSFAGHLAAAVGTATVTIFGPTNHQAWRPYGSQLAGAPAALSGAGTVVTADLPCSPCLYTGYRLGRPNGCPARTCIQLVEVDEVFAAAMGQIERSS